MNVRSNGKKTLRAEVNLNKRKLSNKYFHIPDDQISFIYHKYYAQLKKKGDT